MMLYWRFPTAHNNIQPAKLRLLHQKGNIRGTKDFQPLSSNLIKLYQILLLPIFFFSISDNIVSLQN